MKCDLGGNFGRKIWQTHPFMIDPIPFLQSRYGGLIGFQTLCRRENMLHLLSRSSVLELPRELQLICSRSNTNHLRQLLYFCFMKKVPMYVLYDNIPFWMYYPKKRNRHGPPISVLVGDGIYPTEISPARARHFRRNINNEPDKICLEHNGHEVDDRG